MTEPQARSTVTELLARAGAEVASALASVFPLVYAELHRLAQRQLRRQRSGHTLSPAALVHAANMRLVDYTRMAWSGRAHSMAVAATAMRRVLVEYARSRRSVKRGGALQQVSIESIELATAEQSEMLLALDEALATLREPDDRQARVVERRFFGGMTEEETAEALGIGLRTAKRDWAKARSRLHREIYSEH